MRHSSLLAAAALAFTVTAPLGAALVPGSKAPDFKTQGAMAGKVVPVRLSTLLKRGPVVLYFFPAAFTPGCNAEAKAFADQMDAFRAAGATVIGMSADDVPALQRFSTEHCAGKFTVASASADVARGYDVVAGAGRTTARTSYVIAPDGRIVFTQENTSPAAHVRNTLEAVRAWRAQAR
ncbi:MULTISPECIES: peroxiredoxin [unclassified Sphingomonas]|uniref:peroxiredoxin n=1 Tax=unclassified Sphingomonas TaxID=196159 RepID=UPI0008308A36|nr:MULTISPECIES: peroxiredoxin [unclassified Sphingomonas]